MAKSMFAAPPKCYIPVDHSKGKPKRASHLDPDDSSYTGSSSLVISEYDDTLEQGVEPLRTALAPAPLKAHKSLDFNAMRE